MQEEINSLHERNVWKLVPRPKNQDIIRGKWVFTIKEDGQYRACYVAKGYSQIQGIDYNETFSPVARYKTIRTLLALATIEDWEINTMDVKTAYLYGQLDHDIYMEQPNGFITKGKENLVCKLERSLYGLKQAGRQWNNEIH